MYQFANLKLNIAVKITITKQAELLVQLQTMVHVYLHCKLTNPCSAPFFMSYTGGGGGDAFTECTQKITSHTFTINSNGKGIRLTQLTCLPFGAGELSSFYELQTICPLEEHSTCIHTRGRPSRPVSSEK